MTKRRQNRLTLSKLFADTQRWFVYLMGSIIVCLGAFYLFMLNGVAMRGYVLTLEASAQQDLLAEIQILDAVIAKKQAREYLAESPETKVLEARRGSNYVIVQPTYTAQAEEPLLSPNF